MAEEETKKILELTDKFTSEEIGWSDYFSGINSIVDKKNECNLQHYLQELLDEPQKMEDAFEDAELYTAMLNIFQKYSPKEPLTYRHMLTWMAADYKEPKYKLNILEFSLLKVLDSRGFHNLSFKMFDVLMESKEHGYYESIDPNAAINEIIEHCEVVE